MPGIHEHEVTEESLRGGRRRLVWTVETDTNMTGCPACGVPTGGTAGAGSTVLVV